VLVVLVAALVAVVGLPRTQPGQATLSDQDRALLATRLSDVDASVDRLVAQGTDLATASRDVLAKARALDPDGVDAAILAGSRSSAAIAGQREDLIKRREVLLAGLDPARIPASDRARIAAVDQAIIGVTQLPTSWASVVAAATGPRDLVRSIQAHDARVVDATAAARADDLPGALAGLEEAQRLLGTARAIRGTADEAGADVSTLDDLLARLDAYDAALTHLYTLLQASGGTVTDEIRTAYADVGAAQESLPLNQDALQIVVADLGGQAIQAALVDMEAQRGLLANAVAARPSTEAR